MAVFIASAVVILTGAIGVIHDSDGRKHSLVVEVKFLGRAVAVPIEPDQVKLLFD
jgi:transcription antitermination factor NusG